MNVPHELINIFEELDSAMSQFHYRCEDVSEQVSGQQGRFEEALHKNKRKADDSSDRVDKMKGETGSLRSYTESFENDYHHTQQCVNQTNKKVGACSHEIEGVLKEWKEKKADAQVKFNRAQENYSLAVKEWEYAYRSCAEAWAEHDRMSKQLVFLSRDNPQWNYVKGEQIAQLCLCRKWEQRRDLADRKKDQKSTLLEQAKAWLLKCQHNVQVATDSKSWADKALSAGKEASDLASKEKETLDDAHRKLADIDVSLHHQEVCIDTINEYILKSSSEADNSKNIEYQIKKILDNHEGVVSYARQKLEERIDLLEQFDHDRNII